jgi:hypothetical protein
MKLKSPNRKLEIEKGIKTEKRIIAYLATAYKLSPGSSRPRYRFGRKRRSLLLPLAVSQQHTGEGHVARPPLWTIVDLR